MKIILEKQEAEEIFFNALCNGLGYMCSGYDLELDFVEADYKAAATKLKDAGTSPCFEDVLMQVLKDGGSLNLIDLGCDGEYSRAITLADVHERVCKTQVDHLMDMINGQDDACTADVVLQTVFLEDVVFG